MSSFEKMLQKSNEYGEVMQVKHPIAILNGLPGARLHEMIIFENGVLGEVFAILKDQVQVAILSREPIPLRLKATYLNKFLSVPVGKELFGHTIDPLGRPFSNEKGYQKPKEEKELDLSPLGISHRAKIDRPLLSGVSIVDLVIPLGMGQKELVIGDRKTGKSSLLYSVMKNQARLGSKVIYAAIARQQSEIKRAQEYFHHEGIARQVLLVATLPYDSPSLIFLTPYSAMTIAEYFKDRGEDVLLVFDDLSAHARFYREISLIAKRFPGRDSFPGDIFYIHSRLLERAGNFKMPGGSKAVSVLAAVEAAEGDFTGFIPTNLMSITDGHIFFDSNIFHKGQRPAINVALSVTRVGRQAQQPLVRDINKTLTIFLNKHDAMESLAHFGAELTGEAQNILKLGGMLKRLFQQTFGQTLPLSAQLLCLALVWLNWVTDEKELDQIKEAVGSKLETKEEKWTEEMLKQDTFEGMLKFVKSKKGEIEAFCAKCTKTKISFDKVQPATEGVIKAPSNVASLPVQDQGSEEKGVK